MFRIKEIKSTKRSSAVSGDEMGMLLLIFSDIAILPNKNTESYSGSCFKYVPYLYGINLVRQRFILRAQFSYSSYKVASIRKQFLDYIAQH